MTRVFLLFVLVPLANPARSQVLISLLLGDKLNSGKIEFGLDGGLNLSGIGGLNNAGTASRFNLGFYFDIKLKNPEWMVHTGVVVKSTLGAKNLPVYSLNDPALDSAFTGGQVNRKLAYFNVPVMIKHQFRNNFFIEAGPMLGLMYNETKDVFSKKIKDKDDLTYTLKVQDQYHRLDAGLMGGVGYRLMGGHGMNLGIRYYYGLVDIVKDNTGPKQYNRSTYFTVGIPIGKGKAEKKE